MSRIEKEVGARPSRDILEFKKDVFDFPTLNSMLLLVSPSAMSKKFRLYLARYRTYKLMFTAVDKFGNQFTSVEFHDDDKTYGPNHASKEAYYRFINFADYIFSVVNLAMTQSPRAQQQFHKTLDKYSPGTHQFTSQLSSDTKFDETMGQRPDVTPPPQEPAPEAEDLQALTWSQPEPTAPAVRRRSR